MNYRALLSYSLLFSLVVTFHVAGNGYEPHLEIISFGDAGELRDRRDRDRLWLKQIIWGKGPSSHLVAGRTTGLDTLIILNTFTKKEVACFDISREASIHGMDWSADGRFILIDVSPVPFYIDIESGEITHLAYYENEQHVACRLTPDGKYIADLLYTSLRYPSNNSTSKFPLHLSLEKIPKEDVSPTEDTSRTGGGLIRDTLRERDRTNISIPDTKATYRPLISIPDQSGSSFGILAKIKTNRNSTSTCNTFIRAHFYDDRNPDSINYVIDPSIYEPILPTKISISPNGQFLAVDHAPRTQEQHTTKIFALPRNPREIIKKSLYTFQADSSQWCPVDSRYLASLGDVTDLIRELRILDISTGEKVASLIPAHLIPHTENTFIDWYAWSPCGTQIAIAFGPRVIIWDVSAVIAHYIPHILDRERTGIPIRKIDPLYQHVIIPQQKDSGYLRRLLQRIPKKECRIS